MEAATFKFCSGENIYRTLAFNTQECLSELENIFIPLQCCTFSIHSDESVFALSL